MRGIELCGGGCSVVGGVSELLQKRGGEGIGMGKGGEVHFCR